MYDNINNQYPNQYANQYPNQYPCQCQCGNYGIYPVPYMPVDPMYAHAYVPYQSYTTVYPLEEALEQGTLFPELTNLYDPYGNSWKEEK